MYPACQSRGTRYRPGTEMVCQLALVGVILCYGLQAVPAVLGAAHHPGLAQGLRHAKATMMRLQRVQASFGSLCQKMCPHGAELSMDAISPHLKLRSAASTLHPWNARRGAYKGAVPPWQECRAIAPHRRVYRTWRLASRSRRRRSRAHRIFKEHCEVSARLTESGHCLQPRTRRPSLPLHGEHTHRPLFFLCGAWRLRRQRQAPPRVRRSHTMR